MYAASVSWIVLSYSFRAMTRRASASLIFDNRSVKMLRGASDSEGRPRSRGTERARAGGEGRRKRKRASRGAHLKSFWIFAFSSSSLRIAVFTYERRAFDVGSSLRRMVGGITAARRPTGPRRDGKRVGRTLAH